MGSEKGSSLMQLEARGLFVCLWQPVLSPNARKKDRSKLAFLHSSQLKIV